MEKLLRLQSPHILLWHILMFLLTSLLCRPSTPAVTDGGVRRCQVPRELLGLPRAVDHDMLSVFYKQLRLRGYLGLQLQVLERQQMVLLRHTVLQIRLSLLFEGPTASQHVAASSGSLRTALNPLMHGTVSLESLLLVRVVRFLILAILYFLRVARVSCLWSVAVVPCGVVCWWIRGANRLHLPHHGALGAAIALSHSLVDAAQLGSNLFRILN